MDSPMKKLIVFGAVAWLAMSGVAAAQPAPSSVYTPTQATTYTGFAQPVVCITPSTGAIVSCVGSGGGGGGAVTAVAGAYALGSIVDLGTGATPGANTTNGYLKAIDLVLGSPFQAGGALGAGSANIGHVDGEGTATSPSGGVLSVQGVSSGTPTETSVTCGTTSTTLLAASTATQFITYQIPPTAANAVWFNVAGAAATTASPSEGYNPGGQKTWSRGQDGYLPTSQINCIATASTVVTLTYK